MQYNFENTNVTTSEAFLACDPAKDTLLWKTEQTQDKKQKVAILKYFIQKGTIGGVGSMFGGTILLKGLQSKFTTHTFSFDEARKDLLKKPLAEILAAKESMTPKEYKDLLQMKCSFELFSDEVNYQSEDSKPAIDAVQEMHKRICESIAKVLTDLPKNPNFINAGFLQCKYDTYRQADTTKLTVDMNLFNLVASGSFDDSVEIVSFDAVTGQFKDLKSECKTLNDYIMLLRNKRMDIVIYYDSCSVKRTGRDVALMPKLRVHQIIIHDYVRKQQATIGLNLSTSQ